MEEAMSTKKLTVFLAALSALVLQAACPKKTCAPKGCPRRVSVSCARSTCTRPTAKKTPCGTHTTTVIIRRPKGRPSVVPPAPGRYHIHFERRDFSNSLEHISVPYPTRSRYRGS